jgi:hypothetical protein
LYFILKESRDVKSSPNTPRGSIEAQEPDLIVPCHVSCGIANVIDASIASLGSL